MTFPQLLISIASVLASAAPLILATMGETITERAGVINLSLDGTILLSAMVGFAVGLHTNSVIPGFIAAAVVGMLVALVLSVLSISLNQSQTAVGFVLTLLCTDLSSFLGNPYVRVPGVAVPHMPIPLLKDIPLIGPLFFNHDPVIYGSFLLIPLVWWVLFHTRTGLVVRALGERPSAAFARGINVTAWRYSCVLLGGALVGLAGAAYSLDLKQGWSYRHVAGMGWIALAIVIFGGWRPWRVAIGCYLFGVLQVFATRSQSVISWIPTQVLNVAPFVLMIGVLVVVSQRKAVSGMPAELGKAWEKP
jgi:simple sugar transport system permease protein